MPERHLPAYRPMTVQDIQVTAYVRKAALESNERGRDPGWIPYVAPHFEHIIATDPDGSFIAEIGGLVVGYAQAIVRGDIWFLCQLFVQPELHGLGIGHELLRRAIAYGRDRHVRVLSVVSSTSPVAQSLYMRNGMYSIGILYRMTGPIVPLLALPGLGRGEAPITDCAPWQDRIAALDLEVFGAERRQDHALYLRAGKAVEMASFGTCRGEDLLGYGYADANGSIGPIAAAEPSHQLPLLKLAAEWLGSRQLTEGRIWVISLNHTLMSALLAAGWRINSWTFLLASAPFARFDRYHPANGLVL